MERHKAITTAAAASLTLLAGAAGITLNSGIVGGGSNGNVGQLSPVSSTTNPPITVYLDEPAPIPPVTPSPPIQPTTSQPVTTSGVTGDRDDDRDEHGDDDGYEYEGAEDDD
jgi:hypothetical protein